MIKVFIFSLFVLSYAGCKKNCGLPKDGTIPKEDSLPAGTLQAAGVLHYDHFPDGWGLYYQTDSSEYLILKNNFSGDSAQYQHYKVFVNLHTILRYQDHGETGCLYGIGPSCGHKIVEVVSLTRP
jgi:hypothetical protein